ncbi:RICIN domain-containing protein [Kitasatospora nipponensis]|uniref:RICIN domain-containing protein n=1 Tax=Kitasatospora nipponensis TaxID=258049 RepID=UPI0031D46156
MHFPARPAQQQINSLSPEASSGHHACLDVDRNGTANGTPIQLWDCHGGANQSWTYNGFQLRANGKCLDLPGDNTAQGTELQLWDCVEVASQR